LGIPPGFIRHTFSSDKLIIAQ